MKRSILNRFAALLAILALLTGAAVAFANPASAATKSKLCYASDGGYRLNLIVEYDKANGLVDLNYTQIDQEHRTLGVWSNQDWASSWTVRWVVNGVIISDGSGNPPQALQWNPGTAAQTYDPPVYTRTTFSGSGTSITNCRYDIP